MTDVHSCSYYCDRPECIKAQRDELRERLAQPEGCQCPACKIAPHASNCAVHNEPAYPIGKCDCGAQPEQEPVAWMWKDGTITSDPDRADGTWTPLYTAPPRREWVGLTDEAIWLEYQRFWPFHPAEEPTLAKDIVKFARAIEAKLKEKNNG